MILKGYYSPHHGSLVFFFSTRQVFYVEKLLHFLNHTELVVSPRKDKLEGNPSPKRSSWSGTRFYSFLKLSFTQRCSHPNG